MPLGERKHRLTRTGLSLRGWAPVLFVALLCSSGCAALLRAPTALEKGTVTGEEGYWKNNSLLESTRYRALRIEVDWAPGCEPRTESLAALLECARTWCDKPDGIELILHEELPASALPEEGVTRELVRQLHRQHSNRQAADGTTYYLHVLYLNRHAGRATRGQVFFWADGTLSMNIFRRTIDSQAFLWLSAAKLERLVLVHEFGHVLGLVTNPRHRLRESDHCCNPTCIMYAKIDPRSVMANFLPALFLGKVPRDFCDECKADLRPAARASGEEGG